MRVFAWERLSVYMCEGVCLMCMGERNGERRESLRKLKEVIQLFLSNVDFSALSLILSLQSTWACTL